MSSPYRYRPLKRGGEFRQIILQPGQAPDVVRCELRHAQFTQASPYEAISYEWGRYPQNGTILVDNGELTVTMNLVYALSAFRYPDQPRYVWADAICIDQGNNEEKSDQVSQMKAIYGKAASVLVWLGKGDALVKGAFEIMALLAAHWRSTFEIHLRDLKAGNLGITKEKALMLNGEAQRMIIMKYLLSPSLYGRKLQDENLKLQDVNVWQIISSMMRNTYFERSWIQQEVAVSENVNVHCGVAQTSWEVFEGAATAIHLMNPATSVPDIAVSRLSIFPVDTARRLYRDPNFLGGLGDVLATFADCKETRAQDRIYAAAGLAKRGSKVQVDYDRSAQQVFIDAATTIIRDREDLWHLGNKSMYIARTMPGLPSWVPEWTGPTAAGGTTYFNDILNNPFFRCVPGKLEVRGPLLYVNGHILDTVEDIFIIEKIDDILDVFGSAESLLHRNDKNIFDEYAGKTQTFSTDPGDFHHNLTNAFALLARLPLVSESLLQMMRGLCVSTQHVNDNKVLNIEALWNVLVPDSGFRRRGAPPAFEKLFLVTCSMYHLLQPRERASKTMDLPKGFGSWLLVALTLTRDKHPAVQEHRLKILAPHFERALHGLRLEMEAASGGSQIFITSKGYFGRTPRGAIEKGQHVAVMAGAWVPYILQKQDDFYTIMSHAYVEGIMDWSTLPPDATIERLEIR